MRYYGTITGLDAKPAATPLLPTGGEEEETLGRLGLLCVVGAVVVAGLIYVVTKALTKRGRS